MNSLKAQTKMLTKRLRKRRVVERSMNLMAKNRMKEWTAFLKDDGDFDYVDILKVLRYKLERVRVHIRTHDMVMDAGKISSEIKSVLKLLDRVIKDDYETIHVNAFLKKHGLKMKCGVDKDGKFDSGIPDELSSEFLSATDAAFMERKEDLKKAFELLSENMWSWWD